MNESWQALLAHTFAPYITDITILKSQPATNS